jgi:hypothetical protein
MNFWRTGQLEREVNKELTMHCAASFTLEGIRNQVRRNHLRMQRHRTSGSSQCGKPAALTSKHDFDDTRLRMSQKPSLNGSESYPEGGWVELASAVCNLRSLNNRLIVEGRT